MAAGPRPVVGPVIAYVARRLALSVVVVWGLATVTFFMLHLLVPGDPVRRALGPRASEETIGNLRHQLGFDRPILEQYGSFLGGLLHGDLGTSLSLSAPVSQILGDRIVPSVLLIAYGLFVAFAIGLPLGVLSAIRPNGTADHGVRIGTTFVFGMPVFWLGLILALVFGLKLGWFPVSGYRSGVGGTFKTLTLPALTLGLSLVVIVTRTLRSNLINVLKSEYIEAARSRGLSERRIVGKLAMRNAIMPTFTILGALIGYLIGGTVVIEQVYQIPGAGSLLVRSILQRDFQTVLAVTLISGAAVVMVSFLTDVLQAVLDPRVRLEGKS
jgi:peptide/nickel transport system permease protein